MNTVVSPKLSDLSRGGFFFWYEHFQTNVCLCLTDNGGRQRELAFLFFFLLFGGDLPIEFVKTKRNAYTGGQLHISFECLDGWDMLLEMWLQVSGLTDFTDQRRIQQRTEDADGSD